MLSNSQAGPARNLSQPRAHLLVHLCTYTDDAKWTPCVPTSTLGRPTLCPWAGGGGSGRGRDRGDLVAVRSLARSPPLSLHVILFYCVRPWGILRYEIRASLNCNLPRRKEGLLTCPEGRKGYLFVPCPPLSDSDISIIQFALG